MHKMTNKEAGIIVNRICASHHLDKTPRRRRFRHALVITGAIDLARRDLVKERQVNRASHAVAVFDMVSSFFYPSRRLSRRGTVALALGAGVNVPGQSLSLRGQGRGWVRPVGFIISLFIGCAAVVPAAEAARVDTSAGGPVYEAIVIDAETGQVLRQLNPDAITYPASLTKMMTLYLTFEALNQGRIRLDQYVQVSAAAAAHAPSRLGFEPGEWVMIRDLILGIVTKSANDAAAVLAETLGGTEANFALMMTQKAQQLGMTRTHYANASGLPDPEQLTTARDIARLALALYHDFPREYRYFSVKQYDFQGETVNGHDHMLDWYPGADGIKTGFTVASGYNLATSAVQNGRRLIGVILGGRSVRSRDASMGQLLDLGFADLARQQPVMVAQRQAPVVAAATPAVATPAVATQTAQLQPSLAAVASASMAAPSQPAPASAAVPEQQASAAPQTAVSDAAPARPTAPSIAAVAAAAVSHLAPVAKAEAAPISPEPGEGWAIQMGAFRAESGAEHVEHEVAHLAFARGKQAQILAPAGSVHLYRARLLYFTAAAARTACGELHRQHINCSVVPAGVNVASR
jgi:D-alanyl-D-alanine carboxypeptidase